MNPLDEFFKSLINEVPISEEEAERIVWAVERLIKENPSLYRYLQPNRKEEETILKEFQKFTNVTSNRI